MKKNSSIVLTVLLIGVMLLIGIITLFFGIKETYSLKNKTKDYSTVDGYFYNYDIYDVDEDGITYRLIYIYTVNNKEYKISTDYGTAYIPEKNSIREVKYNPNNPDEAILTGSNSSNTLIYMGIFFILVSSTFIMQALTGLGLFSKTKIDIMGTYIGFVFFIVGVGIVISQNGTTNSLIESLKSFGVLVLVPIIFIVIGIYQMIRSILNKKRK